MAALHDTPSPEWYEAPDPVEEGPDAEHSDALATTVVHVNEPGGYDVYIGRAVRRRGFEASPFANPFPLGIGQQLRWYKERRG